MFLPTVTDGLWYHNPIRQAEVFGPARKFFLFQPELQLNKWNDWKEIKIVKRLGFKKKY